MTEEARYIIDQDQGDKQYGQRWPLTEPIETLIQTR